MSVYSGRTITRRPSTSSGTFRRVANAIMTDPYVRAAAQHSARRAASAAASVASDGWGYVRTALAGRRASVPMSVASDPRRKKSYPKIKPCRPKVKVSKRFKAKVQAVESADQAKGISTTRVMGNLQFNINQNLQTVGVNLVSNVNAVITTSAPGNAPIANIMQWFTSGEALHHASVLFNGKGNDIDNSKTVNNFPLETLVLQIPHASVTMKLHNMHTQPVEVDFYMCIPKISTNILAATDWGNLLAQSSENISAQNSEWFGAEPGQLVAFGRKWSYRKKTFYLKPGASATHFQKQGPLCYTFAKYMDNTTVFNFPKGVGVSCFYVTRYPQLTVDDTNKISAHYGTPVVAGDKNAVSCEVISKWVIEAPEISDDAQKFDKYAVNAYVNVGTTYCQQQVGASAGTDVNTDVYARQPANGHVNVS